MKVLFSEIKYLFIILILVNVLKIKADNFPLENNSGQNSELLIESNKQKSDLENSIFYAEGDVIVSNSSKKLIAKSKKAIFYKLMGKIKLIGNVEVLYGDMNKIKAGEVIYYFNQNKFEAIAAKNQKVNTKIYLNNKKIPNDTRENEF